MPPETVGGHGRSRVRKALGVVTDFALIGAAGAAMYLAIAPRITSAELSAGSSVRQIEFRSASPVGTRMLPTEGPHVVMIFRSTCPYCEQNIEAWARLSTAGVPSYAISTLSGVEERMWPAENGIEVTDVLTQLAPESLEAWNITSVPRTILFGDDEVILAHRGVLTAAEEEEVLRLIAAGGGNE